MKLTLSCFTHYVSRCFPIIAFLFFPTLSVSAQLVEIPDPNLRKAVRETLALPDEIPLNQQEMLRLQRLSAWDSEIADLTGLEHATSLIDLGLCGNQIHNLRPLAGLVQLEGLSLCVNQITDISPLANLINLKWLDLGANGQIVDITPLANLTRLERINLGANLIEDITPLSNLTQLIYLGLNSNRIRDISPLAILTLLQELEIGRNAITDITPLIGLKNLKKLSLADNPIYDFRTLLELEGVELDIDLSRLDELNIVVEVPDPNLKGAIQDALFVPNEVPLTRGQMLQLTQLRAVDSYITDLTGLEYAINLKSLNLGRNQIHDIRPLESLINLAGLSLFNNEVQDIIPLINLTNLMHLNLGLNRVENLEPLSGLIRLQTLDLLDNRVKDITPLASLTELTKLILSHNQVSDLTPLANHSNLEELYVRGNLANDFTPVQGLNLVVFEYDEACDIPPLLPPVRERIENRSFPSVVQAWAGVVGLDHLTSDQRSALHDLHWGPFFWITSRWDTTRTEPTYGVATSLTVKNASEVRQRWLTQNPNMVLLAHVLVHNHVSPEAFPSESDFWLRDAQGQIVQNDAGEYLIDFLKPKVQDLLIKRIIAVERCGFYDGVFLDGFFLNGTGFVGNRFHTATDEEIMTATENILRSVRSKVRDDFLILVNANRSKATRYAAYVNGTFMETLRDNDSGYTHKGLTEIESTLIWSEQSFRSPQINCVEGHGMTIEPPDGPNNLRWMRLFTTMSLTLSDGYVLYTMGDTHQHIWFDFWDANLGRPVAPKTQNYQDIEGLFIREFTNGWAVYNRSGQAQTITLSSSASSVSDRGNNAASLTHQLPDLDGEIYLTAKSFADVNSDGKVNVLDLVQVANGLGKSTPDPNGDGVVDILDLVFVAQQFSQ